MLEAIDKEIDVQMPHDNKNSGQTLSQLLAERDNPVADVAYYGVTTGIKAGNEGVAPHINLQVLMTYRMD